MDPSTGQPQYVIPVPVQVVNRTTLENWSSGLFCGCFEDWSSCCLTCWCPCITFGRIAEILDRGTVSCGMHGTIYCLLYHFTGFQWIYSCMYRSRLRQQYNLAEQPCNDLLAHFCCELRALCQEYRELRHQGFEPSLGWEGNLARRNNQGLVTLPTTEEVVTPPVIQGVMTRRSVLPE